VKTYTPPSAPKAPELPSDLAGELSKYDATEPALAESPKSTSTSASEEEGLAGGAKEFLAFLEKDLPKPVHHH
jgi:F-type H+-transporting ATPase subunit h